MNLSTFGQLDRAGRFLVVAVVLCCAFAFLGTRPLWSPDEGRYTAVALEMVATGDWLHPRLHPETQHYTKPPMTYWGIATSFSLFGKSEWAARIPNALAFLLAVFCVYRIGRKLVPDAPLVAAGLYATMLLPLAGESVITTDTILSGSVALYCWAFVEARADSRARWVWLLWSAAALAFLTKGPPALLPLAGLLVGAFLDGERSARRYFQWLPIASSIALALSWYVLVIAQEPRLLRYFLHDEVLERVASGSFHRHAAWYDGFVVYGPTLVIGLLPWWPLALWRRRGTARVPWRDWSADARLLAAWIGVPLLVFMLARSRLPLYLLPLALPLSVVMARWISERPVGRAPVAVGVSWVILFIALRASVNLIVHRQDDQALAQALLGVIAAPITEVAFVDTNPRYGLRYYLDAGVEQLSTTEPASAQLGTLDEELAESEPNRYFLVETKMEAHFAQFVGADAALAARRLGVAGEYTAYAVCRAAPDERGSKP